MIIFAHEKNIYQHYHKTHYKIHKCKFLILVLPPRVGLKRSSYSLTLGIFSWLILSTWLTIQMVFPKEVTFVAQLTCYFKKTNIFSPTRMCKSLQNVTIKTNHFVFNQKRKKHTFLLAYVSPLQSLSSLKSLIIVNPNEEVRSTDVSIIHANIYS